MVKRVIFSAALFAALSGYAYGADGETCGSKYWPGTLPEHSVDSVSIGGLQNFLDTSPIIEGIKFDVSRKGKELWLDVVRYPGQVTALASIRTIFIIGRVVKPGYDKLVLSDDGKGVFEISYRQLHDIGCQFLWSTKGGQNPIALNRELADSLRYYPNGPRVAPPFNGSLLGDTNAMLTTFNKIVYPQWLLKSVEIK